MRPARSPRGPSFRQLRDFVALVTGVALIAFEMIATPPPAEWPPLVLGASLILGVSVNRVAETAREVMYEQSARGDRQDAREERRDVRDEGRYRNEQDDRR